ncbi:anti sigma factor C-terminal domain-containing protein [Desnuesiella massiliensis]|uniref:anti sigma factor C-terminal domain-containing protein n=1 Tax=Desnuesiella massiliensis TaxID=1650662 RepID=UPI0006E37D84|nr:anti sigma factor C-terminal domain-containing protein [Desnuesiella massiliensis]
MENNKSLEDIFDDNKLKKAIKKSKTKTFIKIISISLLIIIGCIIINFKVFMKLGKKNYEFQENFIKLTVPNGYISKSNDILGVLGGINNYVLARSIGNKPIILEEGTTAFGYFKIPMYAIVRGGSGGTLDDNTTIHVNYWSNGYRKMEFAPPSKSFKKLKNDLKELNNISNDKIIEMALSFDKPYNYMEISKIIPNVKVSWLWIDAFKEETKKLQLRDNLYDNPYISEREALGINTPGGYLSEHEVKFGYNELLDNLKNTHLKMYADVYKELMDKGYTDPEKVPILGVIVYGTKEELKSLIDNPHIRTSSLGVVTNKY